MWRRYYIWGVNMKFIYIEKSFSVSDSEKQKIENKLLKFEKFFENECVTTVKSIKNKYDFYVTEINIFCNGIDFRTEQTDKTLLSSVDLCIDTLFRQIIKSKKKLERKFKSNLNISADEFPDVPYEEDTFEIIKTKNFDIKPMDPEEAILQMNMIGHHFFVFLNSENSLVNVVYKRKDGKYGLISPKM
ncbi:MAG: HPF/RaiA family ribosome-associated protein [Ruminococcaceae bacterium]|nr:HPF/RaiA family ribosome-associated protein [Oscillospiraceae bacterium]